MRVENQVVTECKVPNQENKLNHIHENDVEMKCEGPEVYVNNVKFTHTQTEVIYKESLCQLQQLCIQDRKQSMTHKFEEDVNSAVSQLVSMKIHEPQNIFDEYQNMEVLKKFQNLKI